MVTVDGYRGAETLTLPVTTTANVIDPSRLVISAGRVFVQYAEMDGVGSTYTLTGAAPRRGAPVTDRGLSLLGGRTDGFGVNVGPEGYAADLGVTVGGGGTAAVGGTGVGWKTTVGINGTGVGREISVAETATGVGSNGTVGVGGTGVGRNMVIAANGAGLGGGVKVATNGAAVGQLAETTVNLAAAFGQGAKGHHWMSVALGPSTVTTGDKQIQVADRHFEIRAGSDPTAPAAGTARVYFKTDGATGAAMYVRTSTGVHKVQMVAS